MTLTRTTKLPPASLALALDWTERGIVLMLYGFLVVRMVAAAAAHGSWANLVLLPSEGLVVVFILVRRGTRDVSLRPGHWALALAATAAPLLVRPGGEPILPPVVGALFVVLGMVVQVHAKVSLGRSMGMVPANRGVKLSGPYRHLRHPMYAGYLLSDVAFLLMNPTLLNAGLYLACLALQVPRLLAEERLLARDERYQEYLARVRYRLVPGVF